MQWYLKLIHLKKLSLIFIILSVCLLFTGTSWAQGGFIEDFNDGVPNNWIDDGSGLWNVTNNAYRMAGNAANRERWSYFNQNFENFSYQVDSQRITGRLNSYQGIIFRYNLKNRTYYSFVIDGSGNYYVFKFDGVKGVILIPWTANPNINPGLNALNTLKVVCSGSNIDFYANDVLLQTVKDYNLFSAQKVFFFSLFIAAIIF